MVSIWAQAVKAHWVATLTSIATARYAGRSRDNGFYRIKQRSKVKGVGVLALLVRVDRRFRASSVVVGHVHPWITNGRHAEFVPAARPRVKHPCQNDSQPTAFPFVHEA